LEVHEFCGLGLRLSAKLGWAYMGICWDTKTTKFVTQNWIEHLLSHLANSDMVCMIILPHIFCNSCMIFNVC
jgi:hypothetical protein